MPELSKMVNDLISMKSKGEIFENIKNLLDTTKEPKNIKDVLKLPIHDFRDILKSF